MNGNDFTCYAFVLMFIILFIEVFIIHMVVDKYKTGMLICIFNITYMLVTIGGGLFLSVR